MYIHWIEHTAYIWNVCHNNKDLEKTMSDFGSNLAIDQVSGKRITIEFNYSCTQMEKFYLNAFVIRNSRAYNYIVGVQRLLLVYFPAFASLIQCLFFIYLSFILRISFRFRFDSVLDKRSHGPIKCATIYTALSPQAVFSSECETRLAAITKSFYNTGPFPSIQKHSYSRINFLFSLFHPSPSNPKLRIPVLLHDAFHSLAHCFS